MAQNIMRLVHRAMDDSGIIEPNATLEFYVAGTSTPLTVCSDRTLLVSAGSSVTADAAGVFAERWVADGTLIKLIYKDAAGAVKYTRDYVNDNDDPTAAEVSVVVANNAALDALTLATGLIHGGLYETLGAVTTRDRGEGRWDYDASSSVTTNVGTVRAPASGVGRFFRRHNGWTTIEAWGGKADDTTHDNAAARDLWRTAAIAGTAPTWLKCGAGTYYYLTTPTPISGFNNPRLSGVGPGITFQMQKYTTATESAALIGFGQPASYPLIEDMSLGTFDGFRGGSAIAYVADATSSPSVPVVRNVEIKSYSTKATKTISGFTAASPGVITTSTNHGFATDEVVVLDGLAGGTFWTLGAGAYTAVVTGATTLTLKNRDTGVALDTSGLGSFSSGTIRSGEAFEWDIYADGTAYSLGQRAMSFSDTYLFGAARGVMKLHGVSTSRLSGGTYSTGLNGFTHVSGTVGVPSDSIVFEVSDMGGLNMDRANSVRVHGDIAGDVIETSNTSAFRHVGIRSGQRTQNGSNSGNATIALTSSNETFKILAVGSLSGAPSTKSFGITFRAAPKVWPGRGSESVISSITTTGCDVTNGTTASDTLLIFGEIG